QRHEIMPLWNVAHRVLRPRLKRLVVAAVKRTVIQALWLQEDDRIVLLDRRQQHAFGVIRVRRDHRHQTGHMSKDSFRTLAVCLSAEDASTIRRANRDWGPELASGAIAQPCRLRDQLIERRPNVVGELYFHNRTQTISAHADGCGN